MSVDKVGAKITIGAWSIDTIADARTELVSVDIERVVDSPVSRCRVELYVMAAEQPSLFDQAAGAAAGALGLGGVGGGAAPFSVTVRGKSVAHDDAMTIELVRGDVEAKVMTAKAVSIANRDGRVVVEGRGSLAALAATRVHAVHENRDLSAVVNDLAGAAGVTVGRVDHGDTYPYLVTLSGRTALDHLLALARLEGMSVFEDDAGELQVRRLDATAADRTLNVGIELLGVRVGHAVTSVAQVTATGESPASAKGTSRWHHLLKDPAGAQFTAGDGTPKLALSNYSARSSDAAERLAKATVSAAKAAATTAVIELLGDPSIELGSNVEVKGAAWPDLNGVFRVVRLRHRIGKRDGFRTSLAVQQAAAAEEEGGGLLGAAAGAVGL